MQKQSRRNQRKGDKEEGRGDKKQKVRLMYAKSTPDKIILKKQHCVPKLLGEKQLD